MQDSRLETLRTLTQPRLDNVGDGADEAVELNFSSRIQQVEAHALPLPSLNLCFFAPMLYFVMATKACRYIRISIWGQWGSRGVGVAQPETLVT